MKWGMIGYGAIAPKFVDNLKLAKGETLVAIASLSNAEELKKKFEEVKIYNNYEELLKDPDVEIVYISTTHNFHKKNVLDGLQVGKHVLCEKPLGVSANEVEEMISEAKHQNKFLMEAMWTRFLPLYRKFIGVINSGTLGEIHFVRADFGFHSEWGEERRLYNPDLAGGSILDVGVYPISLINDIFKELPQEISAYARVSHTGVDEHCGAMFRYDKGRIAQMYSSFLTRTIHDAVICGTNGIIRIKDFWHCNEMELDLNNKIETITLPYESTGFIHEIREVIDCIKAGKIESEIMSHQHSLDNAQIADKIMFQIKATN